MKGITTIAAIPGSGSGCQSALPAEKTMESIGIRGFGRVEVVEYRVGEPAPWDVTHESWHYCGPDGRMYQARVLQKTAAQILADVDEFNIPFQRFMIQTPHEWRGAVFSPPPDEVWEIALYDSGVARLIGVHAKNPPADLLDAAGGGE